MKKLFLSILLVLCSGYLFSQNTRQGNDTIDFRDHSAYNPISLTETGYGTEKNSLKWSVTGLNRDKLQKIPAGDVLSRLQGLVPGLTVIGSGQPGEMPLSFIRGMGRLMGSTPLFIVDGVPFVDISLLNPEDIESVAVLKDASAGIYGVRSGNGVIIISTRKAEKGFHVQYNTFMGLQMPGKGTASQVLNTKEHADLQWLVYKNDNTTETHPNYGPSTNSSPTLPSWAANTDWYDALTDRALIQDHDLSVSAGSDNAKALLGVTYYDQDGIILNTDTKRYSVRLNSEISFFKKRIKIGENVAMARRSGRYVPNLTDDSPITMGPYRTGSIIPVYITQPLDVFNHSFQPGEFGGTNMAPRLGNSTNVVADRIRNADDIRDDVNYGGNIYSDISLFKGLNWITSYARTWTGTEAIDYEYPTYENAENNTRSYLSALEIKQNSWVITSALSFNRTFGKNYIQVAGGFEEFRDSYRSYMETSYDIETWTGLKFPEYIVPLPSGLRSEFLKAEYSFNNKYLISYNLRIEKGVKVKTPANVYLLKKRLVYPAISLGWRMSEEKFMNNIGWLDDLKLRASYGKTGSSQPGNYWYEEEYAYSTDIGFDTWL
ncbi:MAG TPA: TonB-dependent receptor plug domain-containing protein, partial [Bacteroidales bacterium]|nr:TonB-dependent receptor plug domain-containing protein [Bacteroidales bacterium]